MTSKQYEQFCRFFISNLYRLPLKRISSPQIIRSSRPGLPEYSHQIDLYWKVETGPARYIHIANAKWHEPKAKVALGHIELLQQIRDEVGAHKAILITNTGFDEGAVASALYHGIALYILRPEIPAERLGEKDPVLFLSQLGELAKTSGPGSIYTHRIVQRGIEMPPPRSEGSIAPFSGPMFPGSAGGTPALRYPTKQGGGPGFRTK